MKKFFQYGLLIALFFGLSSMALHKFYVAIYQINYAPQKKMIQITARLFIDDLNDALENKFHKKTFLGTDKETLEEEALMKKYIAEKFILKINGQQKQMVFLSKEFENNVIICYFNIKDIPKINSLEVQNSIITELYSEQQNIVQSTVNGVKENLLLTGEKTKGMLK
jgi:hypothetical protein